MAPTMITSMSGTYLATSGASDVSTPQQPAAAAAFLLFSWWFNATLFIRADGELRVKNPCAEHIRDEELFAESCLATTHGRGGGAQICTFPTRSGKHILAVVEATGRLIALNRNSVRGGRAAEGHGRFCTRFRVTTENCTGSRCLNEMFSSCERSDHQIVLAGSCADSRAFGDGECPPEHRRFSQVVKTNATLREQGQLMAVSKTVISDRTAVCSAAAHQLKDYPLAWNPEHYMCGGRVSQ